ncbi:MAG: protoporphyrinogen oxidase, partial [Candidatus Dadabacteria bacterium]
MNASEQNRRPSVVVVGAGIAGLATAYRLTRLAAERRIDLDLTVLEAEERAGGNIESVARDGLVLECGPDSIITEKPWGVALCREVGLEERLIPTDPNHRGSFVVRGRRLYPVPDGFHLLAPSKIRPFVTSRLFSVGGKLRMACEPLIPPRREGGDESLASFVRRRLGREALDRIAQPMVGGVYTADPEHLSLQATMPRFLDLERKYGSVIRGMMKAARQARSAVGTARGPRYDLFVALEGGLEELPRRLLELLPPGSLRTRSPVARIRRERRRWIVDTAEDSIAADAVCLAVPAHAAARILVSEAPKLAAELEPIPYASAATVNLIYRREQIGHSLEGFGFVVPAIERRSILACTFGSQKYR